MGPSLGKIFLVGSLLVVPAMTPSTSVAAVPHAEAAIQTSDVPFNVHGRSVKATIRIAAPPRAVFATLTDYDHFHEFMPLIVHVAVLESRSHAAVLDFHMRYMGIFDIHEVDERVLIPPHRIIYRAIKGPMRTIHGAWTLRPVGQATDVEYEANVDPGFPLPPALMRYLVTRGVPGLLHGIQARTESGGTWLKPSSE